MEQNQNFQSPQNDPQSQTAVAEKPAPPETAMEIDQVRLDMILQKYKNEQNLTSGIITGLLAALIGAFVWSLITYFTSYQIGWMAVGIGFLVGYCVRTFGKGLDQSFGITGAVLSLFGCIIGNLLTVCIVIAEQESAGVMEVISYLNFGIAVELLIETFSFMDILFYGLAVYYGYKWSFVKMTDEELQSVMRPLSKA